VKEESKDLQKHLVNDFNWDANDVKKLWCFGPEESGTNALVDQTKAVQFMNEVKDHAASSFQWVTREGVMTGEGMRGIRFNITDANLIADSIHRGGGQLLPASRRLFYASQLTAQPRFQEPVFLAEIQSPNDVLNGIYQCIAQRRGTVIGQEPIAGTPLSVIKAYLPVAESFGFPQHLRSLTSGKAFPQCVFDHWATISADPFDPTS